jgi:hypothetical protein
MAAAPVRKNRTVANAPGDPMLIAMIEKMRRELTTGKGLDG